MARIVLGIGSSHSPQVSSPPEVWVMHVERDKIYLGEHFAERERQFSTSLQSEMNREVWQQKYEMCQAAVMKLHEVLHNVRPDVVVVVGDDQEELFLDELKPAFAVYWGNEICDLPHNLEELHPSLRPVIWAWHTTDQVVSYPVEDKLARHIIETLIDEGFDVAQSCKQMEGRSLGHAYTFVQRRLIQDLALPMVPVFVNCFYKPNQPTPSRCFDFGRALRRAIESWPVDASVALIASGGLSHFTVDEGLDRTIMQALEKKDEAVLRSLPRNKLEGASGEILNWVVVAGAVEHLNIDYLEYVPGYRSPAGTGVGMTFAVWK